MSISTTAKLDELLRGHFPCGFPISRQAETSLEIADLLREIADGEGLPALYALRKLADQYSKVFNRPIHAGELVSVGVILDIFRYLIALYCQEDHPGVISRGLSFTREQRGEDVVVKPPPAFVELYPPRPVLRGEMVEQDFFAVETGTMPRRETIAGELTLLSLAMENPAFEPYVGFFDDTELAERAQYKALVGGLEEFFDTQPVFAPLGLPLFECLRAPMRACPDSLDAQLKYIRDNWAAFLPAELLEQLYLATDILAEEKRMRGLGPGPSPVLQFGVGLGDKGRRYPEPAAFSPDADWMSNVVLIAKSTYVWLDQLSKKYQRHLRYLSDIPDEELDRLAGWGFTGLWLIGIWERSVASQTIKQIMGNPEAAPSAYSLYDYVIAADLGGEAAYNNLRERAARRGIRLASDMVPNHVGIFSKWVIEHPDWFIQSDYPPFPAYRFTGANLSHDDRVKIQIEDGYWEHRDASVVFRREDTWTGNVKYIYHGNDGTSMPWNDTAQLNFLLPEVREAVIQTILHVARMFPIIRFDAAMTLAKKHFQRLWFPQPGDGGAIPSRAEYGMSKDDFDRVFPKEFWREVVDRVAAEVPDTLLLAEAFWLMEGYFVRTLGIHRVYNSAFMNMLKMEDNAKYRTTVKNVLEFSPEVLKRFVNFMNNPDERTAVDQFGNGDKYFGVAMLLVTMPGLPMFGHGQIEGFTEKYGMEYRKAYWDEHPDPEMVDRHEREIFPLMRRRRLFSGAENFAFFDFVTPDGWVDENVFAYTNRAGDERAVILYNNAYNTTRGTIRESTQINVGLSDEPQMVRRNLVEALALNTYPGIYYTFCDYATGLEYLRSGEQFANDGLFAELAGYQYHAFLDFREIKDTDGSWGQLAGRIGGGGVPSINDACREMQLEPVLEPFREMVNAEFCRDTGGTDDECRKKFEQAAAKFFAAAKNQLNADIKIDGILADISTGLDAVKTLGGGNVSGIPARYGELVGAKRHVFDL